MIIRYLSDLHLEFTGYEPRAVSPIGEDLVVLAGDIGEGLHGVKWAQEAFQGRPVVYVLGNHEFYGRDFDSLIDEGREFAAGTNVHLLECDELVIAGLRILGCSLWTDFASSGTDLQLRAMADAVRYMPDYEEIRCAGRGLAPVQTAERCLRTRAWLQQSLSATAHPTLVVTHHAPSAATANPRFMGEISNAAFHSDFDDLLRPPCVGWIHGHTHHSCAVRVNDVPLVTNQRGYPDELDTGFNWSRTIEVG